MGGSTNASEGVLRAELADVDAQSKDALDQRLASLHDEAVARGAHEVVVDLHKVSSIDSSGFKSFVDWISCVQELEPTRRYRVRLRSRADLPWQRRGLSALHYFAVDLVTIER